MILRLTATRAHVAALALVAADVGCHSALFPPNQDPQGQVMRGPRVPRAREPQYCWAFENRSNEEVRAAAIKADNGQVASAGVSWRPEPVGAREGPGLDPIPNHVTMSWKTLDGEEHSDELEVAALIPDIEHFAGTIYLRYGDDRHWTVVPVSDAEALRRMKAHQPVLP